MTTRIRDIIDRATGVGGPFHRDGRMLYTLKDSSTRTGKPIQVNRIYLNVESDFDDRETALAFAEYISKFTPEHVALMESVVEAADEILNNGHRFSNSSRSGYARLSQAMASLDTYRHEHGLV